MAALPTDRIPPRRCPIKSDASAERAGMYLCPYIGESWPLGRAVDEVRDMRAYASLSLTLLLHNVLDSFDVDTLSHPEARSRDPHLLRGHLRSCRAGAVQARSAVQVLVGSEESDKGSGSRAF